MVFTAQSWIKVLSFCPSILKACNTLSSPHHRRCGHVGQHTDGGHSGRSAKKKPCVRAEKPTPNHMSMVTNVKIQDTRSSRLKGFVHKCTTTALVQESTLSA